MNAPRGIPVRYRVLALLFVVSFVNYLLRNSLSVAVPSIREEFGFTSAELGWILGAFNLTYTFLMIPGGVFGERLGARRALGGPRRDLGRADLAHGFRAGRDGGVRNRRAGLAHRRASPGRRLERADLPGHGRCDRELVPAGSLGIRQRGHAARACRWARLRLGRS